MSAPVVVSLLDQDLYKFTMGAVFLHRYSDLWGRYVFKCRNPGIVWSDEVVAEIQRQFDQLCQLRFSTPEIEYLHSIRFLKKGYVESLRLFSLLRDHVRVERTASGELSIEAQGPIFMVSMWEIFVLAIVNEIYFRFTASDADFEAARRSLEKKVDLVRRSPIRFTDFGTRRRFSRAWHEEVVRTLSGELPRTCFTGTSNVDLARRLGLNPIGTMAHEYLQIPQAIDRITLAKSQSYALQLWVDEYRGDLGYALTDTLGFDKFLRDFDLYFAKLYDGVRHDSGDPFEWANRMIEHYRRLGIDPRTKQLIFSDGLDVPLAVRIHEEFADRANVSFGIGTNLTNDFPGVTPLQIVMKLVEVDGRPVAKVSENPAKTMCEDQGFLTYLRRVIAPTPV